MLTPAATDLVKFPADFGRKILVFVDTEEDFDWSQPMHPENVDVDSIHALPDLHKIMALRGVRPHYLVDYPVAANAEAIAVLRELMAGGGARIGSQLHAWANPPYREELNQTNTYPGNLEMSLERAKLHILTKTIEDSFKVSPIVYRAGRYGVGPNTETILHELGYKIDTSVRALFNYAAAGGPNFSHIDFRPYWFGPEKKLLEIPLSNVFVGPLATHAHQLFSFNDAAGRLHSFKNALMSRTKLLTRIGLTPEGMPLKAALKAIDTLVAQDAKLFCISFHSPSAAPGNTPYVRSAADLALFKTWMEVVLDYLKDKIGAQPATVDDVLAALGK